MVKDFQVDRTRFDSRVCIGNDLDAKLIIAMQRRRSGEDKALESDETWSVGDGLFVAREYKV
jgi:hypothetical protein